MQMQALLVLQALQTHQTRMKRATEKAAPEAPTCSTTRRRRRALRGPEPPQETGTKQEPTAQLPDPLAPPPGLQVSGFEWRIEHVSTKLRVSCGYPLISPPVQGAPVPDELRLMFVPGARWMEQEAARNRRPKKKKQQADELPTLGALKLKTSTTSAPATATLRFLLCIGETYRQGPHVADFSEHPIQGCDLQVDWQKLVDPETDSLLIRLEFF